MAIGITGRIATATIRIGAIFTEARRSGQGLGSVRSRALSFFHRLKGTGTAWLDAGSPPCGSALGNSPLGTHTKAGVLCLFDNGPPHQDR